MRCSSMPIALNKMFPNFFAAKVLSGDRKATVTGSSGLET
jgi:hypothetical protein